jgi:hypothetical protein
MQTILAFASTISHSELRRNLAIACVIAAGLTAMAPAFAGERTRGCDWTLKVDGVTKMSGTASGTGSSYLAARRAAMNHVTTCYGVASVSPSLVASCPNLSGWNKSFTSILPAQSGRHNYVVTSSGDTGCSVRRDFVYIEN